jgi:hypothetical protein
MFCAKLETRCFLTIPEVKRRNVGAETETAVNPASSDRLESHERGDFESRKALLIKRLDKSLVDYHHSLEGLSMCEILGLARKIAAMQDTHKYMTTSCKFSVSELDFYLQFQSPLDVVADTWLEQNCNIDDMTFTLDYINDHRSRLLTRYPLATDAEVS